MFPEFNFNDANRDKGGPQNLSTQLSILLGEFQLVVLLSKR